jgi:RNA polymerase sigma factor (sigma-70 family)
MEEQDRLAQRFEAHRAHLCGVAYRMLGSLDEANDAVQEAWLRLTRSDARGFDNLRGWLTTVVARICLDALRSRRLRREHALDEDVSETIADSSRDPESEVLLADSVGLALLVVLDRLAPAERLAYVLHDIFGQSFDEIAPIVERSPTAARQLASRARRRVQGEPSVAGVDLSRQREIAEAFLAAAREGDFNALLAILDPDVVLCADAAAAPDGAARIVDGARAVARGALAFSGRIPFARLALVDGAVGIVVAPRGRLFVVLRLAVGKEKITEIEVIADPARLRQLDLRMMPVGWSVSHE